MFISDIFIQVGKKDQTKSLRTGDVSNTLNRRNLDIAMQEWARLHRDKVQGGAENEDALAKVYNLCTKCTPRDSGSKEYYTGKSVQVLYINLVKCH